MSMLGAPFAQPSAHQQPSAQLPIRTPQTNHPSSQKFRPILKVSTPPARSCTTSRASPSEPASSSAILPAPKRRKNAWYHRIFKALRGKQKSNLLDQEQEAALDDRQKSLDVASAKLRTEVQRIRAEAAKRKPQVDEHGVKTPLGLSKPSDQDRQVDEFEAKHGYKQEATPSDVAKTLPAAYDAKVSRYFIPGYGMSPDDAIRAVGIKRWRVGASMSPLITHVASHLEGFIRHTQPHSLSVVPLGVHAFTDSLDPNHEQQPWSYLTRADPAKNDPAFPRMFIENRAYSCDTFRRAHIELLVSQNRMEVLHVMFFPEYDRVVPMLSLDIVMVAGTMTLGVLDATPVSTDRSLPPVYRAALDAVISESGLESNRGIPDWGGEIFSDLCVCVKTKAGEEGDAVAQQFGELVLQATKMHLMYCDTFAVPVVDPEVKQQVREGQSRVCSYHLQNVKTRRVLDASLGVENADRYMKEVLFPMPGGGGG